MLLSSGSMEDDQREIVELVGEMDGNPQDSLNELGGEMDENPKTV